MKLSKTNSDKGRKIRGNLPMQNVIIYIGIALTLFLNISGCSTGEKKYKLQLKFKPDQIHTIEYIRDNHMTKYKGNVLIADFDYTVTIAQTETVIDTLSPNKAHLKITVNSELIKPNSENSEVSDTSLSTSEVNVVMHSNGSFEELLSSDCMVESSREYLTNYFDQISLMLPQEPVGVGHQWEHSVKVILKDGKQEDAIARYRIERFEEKSGYFCAVISHKSKTIIPVHYSSENGDTTTVQLNQTDGSGFMYLAIKEGVFVYKEGTTNGTVVGTTYTDGRIENFRHEFSGNIVGKLISHE